MAGVCIVPRCNDGTSRPRETAHDRYACAQCVTNLRHTLRGIEVYAHILTIMTQPTQGHGERRPTGFGSRPPTGLDRVVALDYRSRTGGDGPDDEERPTRSVLGTLHQLAREIRQQQYYDGVTDHVAIQRQPTITTEVGYLLGAMEWCARLHWVDELAEDLRDLHGQVRRLAGDQPPRAIGRCTTLLDGGAECGTPLFMPTRGDTIRCHGCGREWPRPEWERLAKLLSDERRAG